MGQPPWLWRRRCMGQSLISDFTGDICVGQGIISLSDSCQVSVILPTSECNVACDYCFEHKMPHRLSSVLVPLLTPRLL